MSFLEGLCNDEFNWWLTATLVALTVALTVALLSEPNRIRAALHGAASHLADTTDGISRALQGLTEKANNVRHFY